MTPAVWGGYALLVAICWIGGLRVLRIALRTQEVREWGLAVVLLCTGGIGYPLFFLRSLLPLSPEAKGATFAVGLAALSLGSVALYVFNWRLFRPHSVAAALLSSAASFAIAWSFLAELLTLGYVWERDPLWVLIGGGGRCLPYAWGAVEALRLGGQLEASEPQESRRFRLYGASLGLIALIYLAGIASALRGDGSSHPPSMIAFGALGGIPSALALWLAFRPASRPARGGRYASSSGRST